MGGIVNVSRVVVVVVIIYFVPAWMSCRQGTFDLPMKTFGGGRGA